MFGFAGVVKSDDLSCKVSQDLPIAAMPAAAEHEDVEEKLHVQSLRTTLGHVRASLTTVPPPTLQRTAKTAPGRIIEPYHRISPFDPQGQARSIVAINDPALLRQNSLNLGQAFIAVPFNPTRKPVDLVHVVKRQAGARCNRM